MSDESPRVTVEVDRIGSETETIELRPGTSHEVVDDVVAVRVEVEDVDESVDDLLDELEALSGTIPHEPDPFERGMEWQDLSLPANCSGDWVDVALERVTLCKEGCRPVFAGSVDECPECGSDAVRTARVI